jgi:hypothetical protein
MAGPRGGAGVRYTGGEGVPCGRRRRSPVREAAAESGAGSSGYALGEFGTAAGGPGLARPQVVSRKEGEDKEDVVGSTHVASLRLPRRGHASLAEAGGCKASDPPGVFNHFPIQFHSWS